jgi:uncharacterized protein YndB with AHSA1/START domain
MGFTIEAVAEADVDPAAVFALYADPSTWVTWGHNASRASADGPLVEGGTVDVQAAYRATYHCRIRRLEPGRALELVVRPVGLEIVNVYEVTPTVDGGARIRHAFEVGGPLATPARWFGLGRAYRGALEREVTAVIRLARDRTAQGKEGAIDG